jgi:hypothetical protein
LTLAGGYATFTKASGLFFMEHMRAGKSMPAIKLELEQQLRRSPDQSVDLIIRTAGDATPHLEWLAAAGLRVSQQYRLVPGVALSGRGRDALKLLTQDWVLSVEVEGTMQVMSE